PRGPGGGAWRSWRAGPRPFGPAWGRRGGLRGGKCSLGRPAPPPGSGPRRARRCVQSGEHGGVDGGAVVRGLGVRRPTVREPGAVREVVAAELRAELEDAHPDRALPARLPRGSVGRLPGVYRGESAGRPR